MIKDIPINQIDVRDGFIYGYDNARSYNVDIGWDVDNLQRINQNNKQVECSKEIANSFPLLQYRFYCGYNKNPNIIKLVSKTELLSEDTSILDNIITNHKANICTNWCVKKSDGTFVTNPDTGESQIFNSQETAQQVADALTDAVVVGVVIF
jgi:hypothetical protein